VLPVCAARINARITAGPEWIGIVGADRSPNDAPNRDELTIFDRRQNIQASAKAFSLVTPSIRQMSMPKPVCPEHGDRHCPRSAGAQTAQKQHAGCSSWTRSHPPARIRLPSGAARKVSASARGPCIPDTCAAWGPNREPGMILIPGDGAAGDQGLRIGPPARQWRLRDTCRLSPPQRPPAAIVPGAPAVL
jgi:hypothetical protein